MPSWAAWPLLALLATGGAPASSMRPVTLRVRATAAVAPCVEAAARAYEKTGGRVAVETGPFAGAEGADVLVGAAAEVTRAVESGAAAADSDTAVARVPWVLRVSAGNPYQLRDLSDAQRAGIEVWVGGGTAAHAARREAEARAGAAVRESKDGLVPAGAAAALVPLCQAGAGGERIALQMPELAVEAAVSKDAARPEDARAFISFLTSPAARQAFGAVSGP